MSLPGVNGKNLNLPKLSLLMCEPYLLREAIKFVHTGEFARPLPTHEVIPLQMCIFFSVNVNGLTYKLTYLHTRFPDRDFLYCATSLCPNIQELGIQKVFVFFQQKLFRQKFPCFFGFAVIEDQGRDCAEALTRMTSLESLSLENYSWNFADERHYQTTFSRQDGSKSCQIAP